MHIIFDLVGVPAKEGVVDAAALGIYSFIKNNPAIVKQIMEE
jgi:hypothetical protein